MRPQNELREAVLAYLFGDLEEDVGPLVHELAERSDEREWLTTLRSDLAAAKATQEDPSTLALVRLDVLAREADRLSATTAPEQAVSEDRAPPAEKAVVVSLSERRKRLRWGAPIALAMAAAIAFFVVRSNTVTTPPGDPDAPAVRAISTAQAQTLLNEIDAGGFGFSGADLTPRDRGWLLGIVLDLNASATASPNDPELKVLSNNMADRITEHLDPPPTNPFAVVQAGCVALVPAEAVAVAECERGLADYRARRDQ